MYEMSALFLLNLENILRHQRIGTGDFYGQLSCHFQLRKGVGVIVVVEIADSLVEVVVHLLQHIVGQPYVKGAFFVLPIRANGCTVLVGCGVGFRLLIEGI